MQKISVSTGEREAALLVVETTSGLGNGAPRWLQRSPKKTVALAPGRQPSQAWKTWYAGEDNLTPGKPVDKSQVITLLETTKRTGPKSRQLHHMCGTVQLLKSFVPQFPYEKKKKCNTQGTRDTVQQGSCLFATKSDHLRFILGRGGGNPWVQGQNQLPKAVPWSPQEMWWHQAPQINVGAGLRMMITATLAVRISKDKMTLVRWLLGPLPG